MMSASFLRWTARVHPLVLRPQRDALVNLRASHGKDQGLQAGSLVSEQRGEKVRTADWATSGLFVELKYLAASDPTTLG